MKDGDEQPGYAPGDRISAGIIGGALLFVAVLLLDIASNGRISARFGGSPVDEAERITREAVT